MKVKTSITLSEDILEKIGRIATDPRSRSSFIEDVLRQYFRQREKEIRDGNDMRILTKNAEKLNNEIYDVLGYQEEI